MSCDYAVWYSSKVVSPEEAKEIYVRLCSGDESMTERNPRIQQFVDELFTNYPDPPESDLVDDLPESELVDTVYSVECDISESYVLMNIVWSRADEVGEQVFRMAAKHGLVLFDPQMSYVYQTSTMNKSDAVMAFRFPYQKALYEAHQTIFTLSEHPSGFTLFEGRTFCIITADNPGGKNLTQEENDRRHWKLETYLTGSHNIAPSTGKSIDGSWVERGFLVFDVGQKWAVDIGRQFKQNAVVYGEDGKVALAWCESGALEWFYPLEVK